MQPQNNPINSNQSDDVPAGDTSLPSGGSTFNPQNQGSPASQASVPDNSIAPNPAWQNQASADAEALGGSAAPAPTMPAMPPNPLLADTQNTPAIPANPVSQPMAMPAVSNAPVGINPSPPASTMPPNPLLAGSAAAPQANMSVPESSTITPPAAPQPEVIPTAMSDMGGSPPPDVPGANPEPVMAEPLAPEMPQSNLAGAASPIMYPRPGQLPGADQLGQSASGMDQPVPGMDNMGTYGAPPKKSKKALFIIVGAILGVIIISVAVALLLSTRKQPAENINPVADNGTSTPVEVPKPSSGPATPPAGYKTIDKQCYSFALITPNTVPTDQSCSFKKSTFGGKAISSISVDTTTNPFKTIDEFLDVYKQDKTIIGEEEISLDGQKGKQLTYKYSDGKKYSYIAVLITGKNYQQDGKSVTGVGINMSFQDDFDEQVTKNVIDTWRWK